jgi:hypothetical protein
VVLKVVYMDVQEAKEGHDVDVLVC